MVIQEVFAATQICFPALSVLVGLPLVTAALVALCSAPRLAYGIAVAGAVIELALCAWVLSVFVPGSADMQFVERSGM